MKKHIVVIGGGMAGCAAAHSLCKQGYKVTIVEQNDHLGGRMHSERVSDLTFEMGAVFLTSFYTNVLSFLRETGLDKDLQSRNSESFIVRNGVPLSAKRLSTYFGSAWLSFGAKLRLIKEVFLLIPAWSRLGAHEMRHADVFDTRSVAERFSGKYGKELLSYLFEPVLNGYMYWSPERTSQAFLMILLKAAVMQRRTYILKNGLRQIPERAAKGCEVLLSHSVTRVNRKADGEHVVTIVGPKGKRTLTADGIVCATTASAVPKIFSGLTPEQTDFFSSITYSSTAVAVYRVKRSQPTETYGMAYPRAEKQPIAAMTVLSDTSPVANMVKIYASGSIGMDLIRKSDKEIHNIVTKPLSVDLTSALKSGEWQIQRWQEAIPEFNVGHLRKLRVFANGEIEIPNSKIVFAGDYIGGPFVEGAFTSGVEAAARLHEQFNAV
jgi:oxygen-dependent protoporphyrinogen oxidase